MVTESSTICDGPVRVDLAYVMPTPLMPRGGEEDDQGDADGHALESETPDEVNT
jgi:hypothetical protein